MNIENRLQTPPEIKKQSWILYGAMIFSQIIIIVAFVNFIYDGPSENSDQTLMFAIIAAAIISSIVGQFFYIKANSFELTDVDAYLQRQTFYILSWAFAESVTIFGVVSYFMGLNYPFIYIFWTSGLALMFFRKPKFPKIEDFEG